MDKTGRKETEYTNLKQIEYQLSVLSEDYPSLDCDAMAYCSSVALRKAGIQHKLKRGYVFDNKTGDIVIPHVWITTDSGYVVDYRLQKWLGEHDRVPHGLFFASDFARVSYIGEVLETGADVDIEEIAYHLTDGNMEMYTHG